MCYSAECWADYRRYMKEFGAHLHIRDFAKMFGYKPLRRVRTPKALDMAFGQAETPEEQEIWQLIQAQQRENVRTWQEELFKQKRRQADAERAMAAGKVTKKIETDLRVAPNKVKQLTRWLNDADRTELKPEDARFFAGDYVPVMIWEDGRRMVKPMRFQCRLHGWTAEVERKYPGTYNARRDSLDTSWRKHWGHKHAVIVISSFFEHVWRHQAEGRALAEGETEEDVVIQFKPQPEHEMVLACLWSDQGGSDGELLSFAFITDEPPAEVAAAGHDRCVIPIKRENIDAWLQPQKCTLSGLQAILDDRERPYYRHQLSIAA